MQLIKIIAATQILMVTFYLSVVGTIGYIVWHFISKYW